MSGYKHALVTVQPAELERMHFAEQYLRVPQDEPAALVENVRQESSVQIWNGLNAVEQRKEDYTRALNRMGKMVRGLEGRLNHRLVEQEAQVASALQACAGRLARHLNDVLDERDQRYQELFMEEQSLRQAQMESLSGWLQGLQGALVDQSRSLSDLGEQIQYLDEEVYTVREDVNALASYQASREQALTDLGVEWVEAAYAIATFVQQNYSHDFFLPGELEKYWAEADLANANLAQGAYEAGLSLGQQACLHVSELRLQLEQLESDWRIWHVAALEGARELQENLLVNAVVPAMDLDGNRLDAKINVNQWTAGKLDLLQQQVDALVDHLLSVDVPFDSQDLQEIVEHQLPELRAKLEKLILDARVGVLSSQVRINIADMVVEALEEQGYDLEGSGYVDQDMRRGYAAWVRSLDGSEVIIQVDPNGKAPSGNELQIHSLDVEQRSEHELRQRAIEIAASLRRRGLQVGKMEETRSESREPRTGNPLSRQPRAVHERRSHYHSSTDPRQD